MPTPPLSRRTALGGLAALTATAASACTAHGVDRRAGAHAARPARTPEDPDVLLATTVLGDEQAMLDRVLATARRHPRLASSVAGARATHRSHVALLEGAVPGNNVSSSNGSPSGASSPARRTPPVPRRPGEALAALARAEHRLSLVGKRNAFAAQSGAFSRVLASMAAAAAQQALHLGTAAQGRR